MATMTEYQFADGFTLTTNHAASSYGIPVFVDADDRRGYGPADQMPAAWFAERESLWGPPPNGRESYTVARYVAEHLNGTDDAELADFAERFLRQWGEGPQLRRHVRIA